MNYTLQISSRMRIRGPKIQILCRTSHKYGSHRASEHSAFSRVTEYIDWIYKKIGGCEKGRVCTSDCPYVTSRRDVIDTLGAILI